MWFFISLKFINDRHSRCVFIVGTLDFCDRVAIVGARDIRKLITLLSVDCRVALNREKKLNIYFLMAFFLNMKVPYRGEIVLYGLMNCFYFSRELARVF